MKLGVYDVGSVDGRGGSSGPRNVVTSWRRLAELELQTETGRAGRPMTPSHAGRPRWRRRRGPAQRLRIPIRRPRCRIAVWCLSGASLVPLWSLSGPLVAALSPALSDQSSGRQAVGPGVPGQQPSSRTPLKASNRAVARRITCRTTRRAFLALACPHRLQLFLFSPLSRAISPTSLCCLVAYRNFRASI
jgi:hypothetical protein